MRRFWVHSIATATIAKHLAPVFGTDPELSHVAALMHDLGRSGLLAAHPEAYSKLALVSYENSEAILAAEVAEFEMTHCHAGAMLSKAWSLPALFRQVTGRHHEAASGRQDVALVQLCCRLADDFNYQSINRRDTQKPEQTVEQFAPEPLRGRIVSELTTVASKIDSALQTLDF